MKRSLLAVLLLLTGCSVFQKKQPTEPVQASDNQQQEPPKQEPTGY